LPPDAELPSPTHSELLHQSRIGRGDMRLQWSKEAAAPGFTPEVGGATATFRALRRALRA